MTPPCTFVIFGISGDLAARKLIPALYQLHRQGLLSPQTRIVGFARRDWTDAELRERAKQALATFTPEAADEAWPEFAARLSYIRGDYDQIDSYRVLGAHLEEIERDIGAAGRIVYTATPPSTYSAIVRFLHAAGLNRGPGFVRLVVEKPFGHDLESARALNREIARAFDEAQVYRIDHYLAKETAQNIAVLRFANTIFEPLWSNQYVDHVQITMAEDLGVEGRGSFYEEAGVLRDVFQNHLLQLLALVATEPPARFDAQSVRDEKVKVLRAVRCVAPERAVRGQYVSAGNLKGYREEPGVAPDSKQATYAAAEFSIHTWRWAGVPFFVRSGKRLKAKVSEIVLHYKTPPHVPFALTRPVAADQLILRLQPNEGISLRLDAKVPGQGIALRQISLDFTYDRQFARNNPDAYETLVLDILQGDPTLFMRSDEIEEQWRIITPLLEAWANDDDDPAFYAAGSWGPKEADRLLAAQGRRWHRLDDGDADA